MINPEEDIIQNSEPVKRTTTRPDEYDAAIADPNGIWVVKKEISYVTKKRLKGFHAAWNDTYGKYCS